jgi:hypothetical protein
MGLFSTNNRFVKFIFYGNYFYGICTVALCMEASLQHLLPLNSWQFYVLVFAATVAYYTKAYMTDISVETINKRTQWYNQHRKTVKISQGICILTGASLLFYLLWIHRGELARITLTEWILTGIFPAVAILYYGINSKLFGNYNLRDKGWLKPFVIGFTWAGFVTVYPVFYYYFENAVSYTPDSLTVFLFLKNFIFISILCIMFDIKDYASDYHHHIKTFVVQAGLRRTIFYIIIPLTLFGLLTFIIFVVYEHFHLSRILLNTIPFILLLLVGYSMRLRRSTLYYLVVVDGLMLVKAAFGIVAMLIYSA